MSSIPGPVIRFLIDSPALSSAVAPAMQQLRDQARATTQAIAADWQRMSAQIRASLLNEVSTTKQIGVARRELVSVLDREMAVLRTKEVLTTKELSTLKAMTLERERQADAIKRGAAIGITGGTASGLGYAANQASLQTTLGIERVLDSLVNRYFGGAAGSAFRTFRDVSYYSAQASGGTGSRGLFGLSGTALAGVGGAAAIVGIGAALTGIAVEGGKLSIELTKLSEKTGLTTDEVIKLRSASTALDADFDRVTVGFKKFSTELTLASTADLPNASKSAKEAAALFKALGVNVKIAAQDPFAAVQQLSKTLAGLPDGFVKTAAASALFGRGGLELVPIFDKLVPAMAATAKSSEDLAKAMGKDGAADAAERLRAQMVNFKNETDALEVALSQRLLPAMVSTVNWINGHMRLIGIVASGGASLVAEGLSSRFGRRTASSGIDFSVANDFLSSSRDASKALFDVDKALGKVGDGSKEAASAARKAAEEFKRSQDAFYKMITESPTRKNSFNIQQRHDEVMASILGGNQPPLSTAIGGIDTGSLGTILGPISSTGALNGALQPSAAPGVIDAAALLQQINEAHKQKFQTQFEIDRQAYQDEQDQLDEALQKKLISQQEYNDASKKIAQDWAKAQEELNKKYVDEAGSLFDDLISGNTKKFSKSLLKDVESIALKPFRDAFANYLGGIFSRLNGAVNGTGSGNTAGGAGTSTLGSLGGIFGGVFGPNSPGGTPGWWPGSIGLNGRTSTAGPAGQVGVATQTMYVVANVVNLSGPIGGPAGSGNGVSVPGGSNFFGFGGNSFFGNNNPFSLGNLGGGGGFSGLGGLSSVLGKAAPFLASAVLLGAGIGSGSGASISLGASGLATAGAGALANAGKISSGLAGKLSTGFGGAGLLGAGLSEGGVGGALSDISGGVQLGSVIPGVGSLVGGIIGGIAGVIRGIFGSQSWAQQVQNAMRNQAFNAPPSETFSFASNGSIASTLSTGFAQSGNTFSQFGLPSNTPFWANPILGPLNKWQIQQLQSEQAGLNTNQPFLGFPTTNPYVGQGPLGSKTSTVPNVSVNLNLPGLMDPTMASAVFTQHAQTIAQLVGSQVRQSSSGFGRNVRSAVALP